MAFVLLGALVSAAQTNRTHAQLVSETEKNVAALYGEFDELLKPTQHEQDLRVAMNGVAEKIESLVDGFVVSSVRGQHLDADRRRLELDLKQILGRNMGLPPKTFLCGSGAGEALILSYSLHKGGLMGEGGTSVRLRAFDSRGGRLQVGDKTGENMDGYGGVLLKELHSPVQGEAWFLLAGQMTGANGPNTRMRIYAFDGRRFRTRWMPENIWGWFAVRVIEGGFRVDGQYYQENKQRHGRYIVAADGVYRRRPGQ